MATKNDLKITTAIDFAARFPYLTEESLSLFKAMLAKIGPQPLEAFISHHSRKEERDLGADLSYKTPRMGRQ